MGLEGAKREMEYLYEKNASVTGHDFGTNKKMESEKLSERKRKNDESREEYRRRERRVKREYKVNRGMDLNEGPRVCLVRCSLQDYSDLAAIAIQLYIPSIHVHQCKYDCFYSVLVFFPRFACQFRG